MQRAWLSAPADTVPAGAARLMARVGATRGSMITYLMPVVAIGAGVLARDESVTVWALVGTVIVLGGAWIASRSEV